MQLLSRIGNVLPSTVFAAPLILRDKVTAVIYADSGDGPDRLKDAEALDILTVYAAKLLDALSAQKAGPRTGEHLTPPPAPPAPPPPVRPRETVVPQAAAVAAADDDEEGSGTVMFSTSEMNLSTYGQGRRSRPREKTVLAWCLRRRRISTLSIPRRGRSTRKRSVSRACSSPRSSSTTKPR